jgi:hypothetical protein
MTKAFSECLEREGVKVVFGYPGGAILPAYDALKHSKIHHVLVRHEQGATHMADGYARASGEVWELRSRLPGRARPTWSPASRRRCSIPRRLSALPDRWAAS